MGNGAFQNAPFSNARLQTGIFQMEITVSSGLCIMQLPDVRVKAGQIDDGP